MIWTGTGSQTGGWGPLFYTVFHSNCIADVVPGENEFDNDDNGGNIDEYNKDEDNVMMMMKKILIRTMILMVTMMIMTLYISTSCMSHYQIVEC